MAATTKTIINNVAVEVGLVAVSDPYSSADQNFILMRTLLNSAGRELLRRRDWSQFTREGTVTGDGLTVEFTPPTDFIRLINDTGWNRTSMTKWSEPINGPDWQALKASTAVGVVEELFRYTGGRIKFITAPPSGSSCKYEYLSSYWADTEDGGSYGTLTACDSSSQYVLLDEEATTRLLKVKWLQAKGLDANDAIGEFSVAYAAYASADPAPVLFLPSVPPEIGEFYVVSGVVTEGGTPTPDPTPSGDEILQSPDGSSWTVTVDDDGNLVTTKV